MDRTPSAGETSAAIVGALEQVGPRLKRVRMQHRMTLTGVAETTGNSKSTVATQDTITQLISAIRRVGRRVPGGGEVIAAVCTGHDYTQPGKPRIDWTDPDAKHALVSALVTDANGVLAALAGTELGETAAAAVALLAPVAGQDAATGAPPPSPAPAGRPPAPPGAIRAPPL